MSIYRMELDVSTNELVEEGWYKQRLFRDMDPEFADSVEQMVLSTSTIPGLSSGTVARAGDAPNMRGLYFEPVTGTLMRKPVQMEPTWNFEPSHDGLKFRLDDLEHTSGTWREKPGGGSMIGTATDVVVETSAGGTLIGALTNSGIVALQTALALSLGRTLTPILQTKSLIDENAGFYIRALHNSPLHTFAPDFLGIMFGSFFLVVHSSGTADLWYSPEGRDGTWQHRKSFGHTSKAAGNIHTGTPFSASRMSVMVMPFGRGHIQVRIMSDMGPTYTGVYTHPEAAIGSDQNYHITEPGKLSIWTNSNINRNMDIQVSRLGYREEPGTYDATWSDSILDIPYKPTTSPNVRVWWSKTGGPCSVRAEMTDGNGLPWTGTEQQTARVQLYLSGDRYHTPYVDSYKLTFPEKIELVSRETLRIDDKLIRRISVEDGEDWDDQKVSVELYNKGGALDRLESRGEINGKLIIDDATYMFCQFSRPECNIMKGMSTISLAGKNFGVQRIEEYRFLDGQSFEQAIHTDAVRQILRRCGFPGVECDTDTVRLPESALQGQGSDSGGKGELKSQAQIGQPVSEMLDWIVHEFAGWTLKFVGDGVWEYRKRVKPTAPTACFLKCSSSVNPSARLPYAQNIKTTVEPPECNVLKVYGADDSGAPILRVMTDAASIADPTAANYLGRIKTVAVIDAALNTDAAVKQVANTLFADLSRTIVTVTFDGPFIPTLTIGSGVEVEGVGLVWLKSISAEAEHPRQLETGPYTHYSGELIV